MSDMGDGAGGGSPFDAYLDATELLDLDLSKDLSFLSSTLCWGAAICNQDGAGCTKGFSIGKGHFKNKFCKVCRETIAVPASRVRALTQVLQQHYASNSLSAGFWKSAPDELGGGEFRLINNTLACDGPPLVVYRETPPELPWGTLPDAWVSDGFIRMAVAKGTLVPAVTLPTGWRPGCAGSGSSASPRSSSDSVPKRKRGGSSSGRTSHGDDNAPVVEAVLAEDDADASCAMCVSAEAHATSAAAHAQWWRNAGSSAAAAHGVPRRGVEPDWVTPRDETGEALCSSDSNPDEHSRAPSLFSSTPHEGGTPHEGMTPRGDSPVPSSVDSSAGVGELPDTGLALELAGRLHASFVSAPEEVLHETAKQAAQAAQRAALLANLHAALSSAHDASSALLAHEASHLAERTLALAEADDGLRQLGAISTNLARSAGQVQQWMVADGLRALGPDAHACATFSTQTSSRSASSSFRSAGSSTATVQGSASTSASSAGSFSRHVPSQVVRSSSCCSIPLVAHPMVNAPPLVCPPAPPMVTLAPPAPPAASVPTMVPAVPIFTCPPGQPATSIGAAPPVAPTSMAFTSTSAPFVGALPVAHVRASTDASLMYEARLFDKPRVQSPLAPAAPMHAHGYPPGAWGAQPLRSAAHPDGDLAKTAAVAFPYLLAPNGAEAWVPRGDAPLPLRRSMGSQGFAPPEQEPPPPPPPSPPSPPSPSLLIQDHVLIQDRVPIGLLLLTAKRAEERPTKRRGCDARTNPSAVAIHGASCLALSWMAAWRAALTAAVILYVLMSAASLP
jgi:hypothetical protein